MADAVTTVSPTYAREILDPANGMALDGLLRTRGASLLGIVNGIDTDVWNPATDQSLAANYNATTLDRRSRNKKAVEERFGLTNGGGPLFCVISRLTSQKGMDILADAIPFLVKSGGRLAVLGSGDAALEARLKQATTKFPGLVGVITIYDEALSHLLQGGADAILVPSRFEPCGLTQLYGLRYGCVPVVSHVGGLADTVIDANDAALAAGVATGIQFAPVTQDTLEFTIAKACRLYSDARLWRALQQAGMKSDVSWKRSAGHYAALYNSFGKTA
jgi:starch synthase